MWPAAMTAVLAAQPLSAQVVRGRVTLPGDAGGVPGAIVTLVDSSGAVVARALSRADGGYRLDAPSPGAYRVRVLRIGYRPTVSPVIALATGVVSEQSLVLDATTIVLPVERTFAERRCAVHPETGTAAASAWEEARKALEVVALTRMEPKEMEVYLFQRQVKPGNGNVLAESELQHGGRSAKPFVSPPLALLDSIGYVERDGLSATYYAPDEDVLLSEQFVATHCFVLAPSSDSTALALRFEPVRDRAQPEIRGTLLIDRASKSLRRLDFSYVNIAAAPQSSDPGGTVEFRALPTGGWIIERWMLRVPVLRSGVRRGRLQMDELGPGGVLREQAAVIVAMQEAGGAVLSVSDGGRPICGECARERDFFVMDIADGELDGQID